MVQEKDFLNVLAELDQFINFCNKQINSCKPKREIIDELIFKKKSFLRETEDILIKFKDGLWTDDNTKTLNEFYYASVLNIDNLLNIEYSDEKKYKKYKIPVTYEYSPSLRLVLFHDEIIKLAEKYISE